MPSIANVAVLSEPRLKKMHLEKGTSTVIQQGTVSDASRTPTAEFTSEFSAMDVAAHKEMLELGIRDEGLFAEMKHWRKMRVQLFKIVHAQPFDLALGVVILFNLVLVILETDCQASEEGCDAKWTISANYVLLCVYCLELLVKLYVYRLRFFKEVWNIMDMLVVGLDLLLLVLGLIVGGLPSVSILRIFRLVRLVRAIKAASALQELRQLLLSFISAIRACVWGMFLVCVILIMWSIVAVQIIHPINKDVAATGAYEGCDRCSQAFGTVFKAALTFFQQLVAGDSWGTVTIPIVEHAPWTAIFFLPAMVSISMAMLNLVLAVVVDAAMSTQWKDRNEEAREREFKMAMAKEELLQHCKDLDTDGSCNLTLQELEEAFDTHEEFTNTLKIMDISKADLGVLFLIVDQDGTGDVAYSEFVDQLYRLKSNLHQVILFSIAHLKRQLNEVFDELRGDRKQKGSNSTTSNNNPDCFGPRNSPRLTPLTHLEIETTEMKSTASPEKNAASADHVSPAGPDTLYQSLGLSLECLSKSHAEIVMEIRTLQREFSDVVRKLEDISSL